MESKSINNDNDNTHYIAHITERSKCYRTNALVIMYCQLYLYALRLNSSNPLNSKVFIDFLNFTRSPSILHSSGKALHNLGAVYSIVLRPHLVLAPFFQASKNHSVCKFCAYQKLLLKLLSKKFQRTYK